MFKLCEDIRAAYLWMADLCVRVCRVEEALALQICFSGNLFSCERKD